MTELCRVLVIMCAWVLLSSSTVFSQPWNFCNGPYAGTVRAFSPNPIRSTTIFAATSGESGLYRSTNAGGFWHSIGPETSLVKSSPPVVAVNPLNINVVYFGYYRARGGLLFKSVDSGDRWQAKNIAQDSVFRSISSIALDPTTHEIVYVGCASVKNSPIWKSTDGGGHWGVCSSGVPVHDSSTTTQTARAIAVNPLRTSSLFAAITPDGIFRSFDGGATWQFAGLRNLTFNDLWIVSWDTLRIHAGSRQGFYTSTDGGGSWRQIFSDEVRGFSEDPGTHTLYLMTYDSGPFRSTDEGTSWESISNPNFSLAPDVVPHGSAIAASIRSVGSVYVGSDIGPYGSTSGGTTWAEYRKGMRNFYAFDIKIAPSNSSLIYSAGRPGIQKSTDGGASWTYILTDGVILPMAVDPLDPQTIYAGSPNTALENRFLRSTDGGLSWTEVPELLSSVSFPFIEIDRSPERRVYTATDDQFLRSSNKGRDWDSVRSPIIPTTLAIADGNPDLLFIASPKGCYRSTDRGQSWDSLPLPSHGSSVCLVMNPQDAQIIYAGVAGYGVFKSTDGGTQWIEHNDGLSEKSVTLLLVHPKQSDEIFLRTDSDLFRSTTGGNHWQSISAGLTSGSVRAMCVDTSGISRLLVGGGTFPGIYASDFVTSVHPVESGVAGGFLLKQNYPNPFNPTTYIEFEVRSPGRLSLEITDVVGEHVRTLIQDSKTEGNYRIEWDGRNDVGECVSTGVYFYRLISKDSNITRKMIRIR